MDGAILGSIEIALAKAKTSILFNAPSENLWDFCKPGGPAPATEYTNGGLIPYAGGVGLNDHEGALIGAIGVSGGLPAQDGEVARAEPRLPAQKESRVAARVSDRCSSPTGSDVAGAGRSRFPGAWRTAADRAAGRRSAHDADA
jgi:uncharacterized protein GlcG (DUF336 family)